MSPLKPSVAKRTERPRPKKVMPSRWVAWRTVLRTSADDAYTDRAFEGEVERESLDARDRAHAQWLAYGAVQQMKLVDYIIERVGRRPLHKLDLPVLTALRIGVFELRSGDRNDAHATVSQAVEIVRAVTGERAVPFANAVLRRAQADGDDLMAELDPTSVKDRSTLLSMPEWVIQTMADDFDEPGVAALEAQNLPPATNQVRINTLLVTEDERAAAHAQLEDAGGSIPPQPFDTLDEARVFSGSTSSLRELIDRGWVQPQSLPSMLVAHALDPQPGERVLDMCAAPGGKTMHLAALMQGRGSILACDVHEHRAASIAYLASRMGASGIVTARCVDATGLEVDERFDRVLVDAPCSGLGVLQRRPDARWKSHRSRQPELLALQRALLDRAIRLTRPGGVVVYSTCTLPLAECEDQIQRVLTNPPEGMHVAADPLPPSIPNELRIDGSDHMARTWPQTHLVEGFFIARIKVGVDPGTGA